MLYQPEHLQQLKHVLWTGFFPGECLAIGIGVNRPEATSTRDEMTAFCELTLRDGLAIVARDTGTNRVIGHVICKLQVKPSSTSPGQPQFFDMLMTDVCRSETGKAYMQAMIDLDAQVDVFAANDTDVLLEIMFLGVLPEYGGRSIGRKLVECAVQLGRRLRNGNEEIASRVLDSEEQREVARRLGAATAQFSSNNSKRIGERLGFVTHYEMFYDQTVVDGVTMQERIPKDERSIRLVSLAI